ncbi:hypothetical protein CHLRE_06g303650v5 [Chlamydomonas reinhardtii]|uniref:SUI1 domain-containing protein n=1 Tax=Chlamydomonas reinhardtii TaxID=3055 RepID=A0A2K3DRC6_CHLRE|nr:uncharacterized protein CHLRE_06g303650v5 [Chlamydomonas reinhardtii]PNW83028.1 hypothetical protein CHLRE_06g303650v5 [Chlamydomonas reinhardtii]
MFKKPFNLGQSHKVSGADRKKLRKALEKVYGVGEDGLEAILPAKAGELECVKLASPSRVVLYLHDGSPILLDPNGKGDYAPTVFALWRWPDLLPRVYVKHPAVSRYLVGGADLMLPGVAMPAEGLPAFQRDQLLAVCSPGNPAPVAVGAAVMDSSDAAARIRGQVPGGCRGKLVEVMQHYGDCLWSDVGGRAVPNAGFLADGVVPPGVASVEATLNGELGDDGGDDGAEAQDGEGASGQAGGESAADGAAERIAGLSLDGAGGAGGESGAASTSGSGAGAAGGGGEAEAEAVDMDALLESVLLQALTKSVKDGDLPLNSSVLWNQHMLPQRPAGSTLDVKKSKHKKMSKFLQSYGKAGLLTCKEDKHSGDVIVTAVNRKCPLLLDFRPYKASSTAAAESAGPTAGAPETAAATSGGAGASSSAAGGNDGSGCQAQLLIEEVYKPGRELRPIFEELKLNPEALYTGSEAAEVALAYVKAAGLDDPARAQLPDNRTLQLNPLLCDALFKGFIKKGETYPTHLPKSELREAFMRRMHLQCRLSRGAYQVVRKGAPPAVAISTEKRQGNKRVTKIAGLEAFLVDPEVVAGECQRKFACSTSVVDLPGKNTGQEVVLQGSFPEKAADFLMTTYGIPKKYFLVKSA